MQPIASGIAIAAATLVATVGSSAALAQSAGNATYQSFFGASVCGVGTSSDGPPSQQLLARCRDTIDDQGNVANISTDSESSLTPSQVSIAASSAMARARAQANDAEKRLEDLREEEEEQEAGDEGRIATFGPWSLFANLETEWFNQSRPAFANERGFDGDRIRGTLGADYRMGSNSVVGLMLHYEDNATTFDKELNGTNFAPTGDAGSAKAKTRAVTLFGTFSLSDEAWFDAAAGMGWSDNRFTRKAIFQPSTRNPSLTRPVNTAGKSDGKQVFVSAGIGLDRAVGALSYGPYLRGRYVRSTIDAYLEDDVSGSFLNLAVGKQKATSLTTVAGLRASYAASADWGVVLPQVRIEYEHEFKDDPRATLTRFINDPRGSVFFPVINDAPDRNYFNAGAGLAFVFPNGVMPYIDYEALLAYRDFSRHRVTIGLRLEF